MSHNNHDSKMMWLMMIFCALPMLILLFSTRGTGGYGWFAILAIAAFAIGHLWLMRKGCGNQKRDNKSQKNKQEKHSHH